MPKTAPKKQDLINFLTKKYGGQDGKLAVRNISTYNLEEALFWFTTNHGSESLQKEMLNTKFDQFMPNLASGLNQNNHLYKALVEEFIYEPKE